MPTHSASEAAPDVAVANGRRTVAVLGGTGFLGQAFCARFARQGWRVLAVSRNTSGYSGPGEALSLDLTRVGVGELTAVLTEHRVTDVINAAGGMWGLSEEQMVGANVTLVETLIAAIAAQYIGFMALALNFPTGRGLHNRPTPLRRLRDRVREPTSGRCW